MRDTIILDTMRKKMLAIDKMIHTLDDELLQYVVYKAGNELEIRSQEYMKGRYAYIDNKIRGIKVKCY